MFSNAVPSIPKTPAPICALAIDAEEDFDWTRPFASTAYTTDCMRRVSDLQEILGGFGIVPTYLLTYPILEDDEVVHILRRQISRGLCDVGVQLHPWVNPPFEGESDPSTSFSGNLPPGLEERKLLALKRRFTERFGRDPVIYRAGRYGIGPHSAEMLERHGFMIDTSLAPRTTAAEEGGPDYGDYDYAPFWFGKRRRLLELPLCRSTVGWAGARAPAIHRRLAAAPVLQRLRVASLATRLRLAERITLSPEGNDVGAMLRLLRHLRARGQSIVSLSFHSSSLSVGRNPYVQTQADLHMFYDRLSAVLDAMASRLQFRFASLGEIPARLQPPP